MLQKPLSCSVQTNAKSAVPTGNRQNAREGRVRILEVELVHPKLNLANLNVILYNDLDDDYKRYV